MARRAATKKFLPAIFELPGGHVDFGEQMHEGLAREINEELNMSVEIGDPFAVFTYMNKIKRSHSIEVIYFARFTDPIENIQLHPEDHSEYIWVGRSELPDILDKNKNSDDPEIKEIIRGFDILNGGSLQTLRKI